MEGRERTGCLPILRQRRLFRLELESRVEPRNERGVSLGNDDLHDRVNPEKASGHIGGQAPLVRVFARMGSRVGNLTQELSDISTKVFVEADPVAGFQGWDPVHEEIL